MIAYAVHESGRREVLGLDLGEVESGAFWVRFLRSLRARGLAGVRLAVSDHHEGLKAAIARVLGCPWQRCTVHFVRDMHSHCRPSQRGLVSAALREVFNAESHQAARERVSEVIGRLAGAAPKVTALLEEAEEDLIAFYGFPAPHWSKLRSTDESFKASTRGLVRISDDQSVARRSRRPSGRLLWPRFGPRAAEVPVLRGRRGLAECSTRVTAGCRRR